ncbi:aspartate-alanine antiporter [Murinocardiopsis flavida]|uniref:Aspartate-alanine antiporter n=1 Tax=Murinocardiopsis flavida TaxID=645275 RepID=A0A2P8DFB8_9ACTN|nr:aspartate-alanine antiporter [Murinocardiopsis flavida]PSK95911.1 aspartate-alanine antiporter [Murinocardiopsis flavida]
MGGWLIELFKGTPEVALFASLAVGYAVGKIPFGPIRLGGICGTLITALVLGYFTGAVLSDGVKNLAFALFIFALGFSSGPQFFANLNRKGLRYLGFPIIEIVAVLAVVLSFTALMKLDQGTAAGLMAGGATESAALGTSSEAIGRLDVSAAEQRTLQANVATAYTISYLCGLITIVLLTSQIAPLLMRFDLRAESAKLWQQLSGGGPAIEPGQSPALPDLVGRVHRVTAAAGRTVDEVEKALPGRATIEQVRRGDQTLKGHFDLRLAAGDIALLVGRRHAVVGAEDVIGPEQADEPGPEVVLESRDIVLTHRNINNLTLARITDILDPELRQSVFVQRITRTEREIPALGNTRLQTGDVVTVYGAPSDVREVEHILGYPMAAPEKTDYVYLGIGLVIGILIGQISIPVGSADLTLGTGGGALLSGLVFGYLRAKRPTFGSLHPAAASVMKDFGLTTFIAAVGLSAGPQALDLLAKYGVVLPIAAVLTTLIPAMASLLIGRYLLKIEPPLLVGAVAGQQCSTPAISQILSTAGNSVPMISYTITYAISNILLPLMGPVTVALAGAVA